MVTNSENYGSLNLKLIHTSFSKRIDHIDLNKTLSEIFEYPNGSILSEVYHKMGVTAPLFILPRNREEEQDLLQRYNPNMKLVDLLIPNQTRRLLFRNENIYYLYVKSSCDRINSHLLRINQIARSNNLSPPILNRESVLELFTIERLNSYSRINSDSHSSTNQTVNSFILSNNNSSYKGECIVCFERKLLYNYYSCQLNPNYRETNSHHGMCESCITEWLNRNNFISNSCPTCRALPGILTFKL